MTPEARLKRDAIKHVIQARKSDNPFVVISVLSAAQILAIKNLALEIGSKLIRFELEKEKNLSQYREIKDNFDRLLTRLKDQPYGFQLVKYTADLLQFYVFSCQQHVDKLENITAVTAFLTIKENKIGNSDKNIFIKEYKINTLFNELVTAEVDFNNHELSATEYEAELAKITKQLTSIRAETLKLAEENPCNTFVQYLNFLSNYSAALVSELFFKLKEDDAATDGVALSAMQKGFLDTAKTSLQAIQKTKSEAEERGSRILLGEEFSFGRDIMRKIPNTDLEAVKTHVSSVAF